MTPLEIAEYSWREGYRRIAGDMLASAARTIQHLPESRLMELADEFKEAEDRACADFLAFIEMETKRQR